MGGGGSVPRQLRPQAAGVSGPILGLIFLRFAEVRFAAQRKKLEKASASSRRGSRLDEPTAYHADGVLYLPAEARYDYLLTLPEPEDIGARVNAAMRKIEQHNPPFNVNAVDKERLVYAVGPNSRYPFTLPRTDSQYGADRGKATRSCHRCEVPKSTEIRSSDSGSRAANQRSPGATLRRDGRMQTFEGLLVPTCVGYFEGLPTTPTSLSWIREILTLPRSEDDLVPVSSSPGRPGVARLLGSALMEPERVETQVSNAP